MMYKVLAFQYGRNRDDDGYELQVKCIPPLATHVNFDNHNSTHQPEEFKFASTYTSVFDEHSEHFINVETKLQEDRGQCTIAKQIVQYVVDKLLTQTAPLKATYQQEESAVACTVLVKGRNDANFPDASLLERGLPTFASIEGIQTRKREPSVACDVTTYAVSPALLLGRGDVKNMQTKKRERDEDLSEKKRVKNVDRANVANHPCDESFIVGVVDEVTGPGGYPMDVVRVEGGADDETWAFINRQYKTGARSMGSNSHYAVYLANDPEGRREVPFLECEKHEVYGSFDPMDKGKILFPKGSRVKFVPVERERIYRDEKGVIHLVRVSWPEKKLDGTWEIPDKVKGIAARVCREDAPPHR